MIPSPVRAVFFDVVGTLLHCEPPAAAVYADVGRRHGSRLTEPEVLVRFQASFARQERLDQARRLRTSEEREILRWRTIVAEVLDDVSDGQRCFQDLFDHFARPEHWRYTAAGEEVLSELARRGYVLGLASNYDRRLYRVIAGLPPLQTLHHYLISSEVGWCKPAPEYYKGLCRRVELSPSQILLVGDNLVNDFEGARSAGLHALLFDPAGDIPAGVSGLQTLSELIV
jgi:putative hydrolase of the HAD superfamily